MNFLTEALQIQILNNPIKSYLLFAVIFLVLNLVVKIGGRFVFAHLRVLNKRFGSRIDEELLVKCERLILPVLHIGVFYFALKQLVLNEAFDKVAQSILIAVFCIQGIRLILLFILNFLDKTWFRKTDKSPGPDISRSVLTVVRLLIWGIGLVFLLNNLGFNVSAIVAGLGIGGIAVALAAQTILGDLFNYFVILLDKPFREGDFIVTGNFMGTIEDIGIKSTRIRALSGEELVVSNSNLTSNLIHNYKRMKTRRIEFTITVSHFTSMEKLKEIPEIIKKTILKNKDIQFDRAHFKSTTDSGFFFEAVYIVLSDDYNKYMDIQQTINFEIADAFEKQGIDFARPYFLNHQQPA